MATLSITIELDNDAFQADAGEEVARILRQVAARTATSIDAGEYNLRDYNGNTVGSVEISA